MQEKVGVSKQHLGPAVPGNDRRYDVEQAIESHPWTPPLRPPNPEDCVWESKKADRATEQGEFGARVHPVT